MGDVEDVAHPWLPGQSLAVVHDATVVHLAGFGVADRAGTPVTPQTPFMITVRPAYEPTRGATVATPSETATPAGRTFRRAERVASRVAAVALLAAGGLHVAWALGSSWPLPNRARLSAAVLGGDGLEQGGATACYAVAGLLGTAAALVAGRPRQAPRLRRSGVAVVAAALAGRGVLGLAGRTDLVSPASTGPEFRRLDRRLYAPICLGLSALSALSLRPGAATPAPSLRVPSPERQPPKQP